MTMGYLRGKLLGMVLAALAIHTSQATAQPPQLEGAEKRAEIKKRLDELYQAGQFRDALPKAEELLALDLRQSGEISRDVAVSANNAAELCREMGYLDRAERHYQRALAANEARLGKSSLEYAICLSNSALLTADQGNYSAALERAKQAVELLATTSGRARQVYALAINNQATIERQVGGPAEARASLEKALRILRENANPAPSALSTLFNNLAELDQAEGKFTEAEKSYLAAAEQFEAMKALDHANYGLLLCNLADLYREMGRLRQSGERLDEASSIIATTCGEGHPLFALCLNHRGRLQSALNQPAAALATHERALKIFTERVATRHPFVAACQLRMAEVHLHQDQLVEADKLLSEAVAIQRACTPPNDRLAEILDVQAQVLNRRGQSDAAAQARAEAARIRQH